MLTILQINWISCAKSSISPKKIKWIHAFSLPLWFPCCQANFAFVYLLLVFGRNIKLFSYNTTTPHWFAHRCAHSELIVMSHVVVSSSIKTKRTHIQISAKLSASRERASRHSAILFLSGYYETFCICLYFESLNTTLCKSVCTDDEMDASTYRYHLYFNCIIYLLLLFTYRHRIIWTNRLNTIDARCEKIYFVKLRFTHDIE